MNASSEAHKFRARFTLREATTLKTYALGDTHGIGTDFSLLLDGVDVASNVTRSPDDLIWSSSLLGEASWEKLGDSTLAQLTTVFEELALELNPTWASTYGTPNWHSRLFLSFMGGAQSPRRDEGNENGYCRLQCRMHPTLHTWSATWTFETFRRALGVAANNDGEILPVWLDHFQDVEYDQPTVIQFGALCEDPEQSLRDVVERVVKGVQQVFEASLAILERDHPDTSLSTVFDFPAPIRSACEQYLAYFAQFLGDLGIEAETSIRQRAGQVLFSVTPTDGPEGLDRIREALEVYLSIPDDPSFQQHASKLTDLSVRQLGANVLQLQSQVLLVTSAYENKVAELRYTRAENELQAATIEFLKLTNLRLADTRPAIVAPTASLPRGDDQGVTKEEPIGRFLAVRDVPVKGTGVVLKLPAILRALKREL